MASSPSEIQARFLAAIPDEHLRGLAMCIWAGYPESFTVCSSHMPRDQAHDARGDFRRGLIERNIKNYARRIPGAVVRQERNSVGSSCHVAIDIGGITITQSQADGPNKVVQKAAFRDGYAEQSQLDLFKASVQQKPTLSDSRRLYVMLLHGPATNPKQPRFLSVVFPTNDCESYVFNATINLFSRFGDLAQAIMNERTEVISDDLMLDLRRLDEAEGDEAASA
jgi:hypothetical protein